MDQFDKLFWLLIFIAIGHLAIGYHVDAAIFIAAATIVAALKETRR